MATNSNQKRFALALLAGTCLGPLLESRSGNANILAEIIADPILSIENALQLAETKIQTVIDGGIWTAITTGNVQQLWTAMMASKDAASASILEVMANSSINDAKIQADTQLARDVARGNAESSAGVPPGACGFMTRASGFVVAEKGVTAARGSGSRQRSSNSLGYCPPDMIGPCPPLPSASGGISSARAVIAGHQSTATGSAVNWDINASLALFPDATYDKDQQKATDLLIQNVVDPVSRGSRDLRDDSKWPVGSEASRALILATEARRSVAAAGLHEIAAWNSPIPNAGAMNDWVNAIFRGIEGQNGALVTTRNAALPNGNGGSGVSMASLMRAEDARRYGNPEWLMAMVGSTPEVKMGELVAIAALEIHLLNEILKAIRTLTVVSTPAAVVAADRDRVDLPSMPPR